MNLQMVEAQIAHHREQHAYHGAQFIQLGLVKASLIPKQNYTAQRIFDIIKEHGPIRSVEVRALVNERHGARFTLRTIALNIERMREQGRIRSEKKFMGAQGTFNLHSVVPS